jgi:cytochrome P450
MTFDELTVTTVVLIVAGSETVATQLSGLTYYLCSNPAVLARLNSEIRSTFKEEKEITMVSTNSLTYLNAVLSETLRIYPASVGILARVTPPEGCVIANRFVPGNTSVSIARWSASRSASNFMRPDEFIPERWLEEEEFKVDDRKMLQPFSVGPRNCIGRNLAMAEMRVLVARLAWGFDMKLEEVSREWDRGQKVFLVYEKPSLWVSLRPVGRE